MFLPAAALISYRDEKTSLVLVCENCSFAICVAMKSNKFGAREKRLYLEPRL